MLPLPLEVYCPQFLGTNKAEFGLQEVRSDLYFLTHPLWAEFDSTKAMQARNPSKLFPTKYFWLEGKRLDLYLTRPLGLSEKHQARDQLGID